MDVSAVEYGTIINPKHLNVVQLSPLQLCMHESSSGKTSSGRCKAKCVLRNNFRYKQIENSFTKVTLD